MTSTNAHATLGRAEWDAEVLDRAIAQQSQTDWEDAQRLCHDALSIIVRVKTGEVPEASADLLLAQLSERAEPEARALANHLVDGLSAFFHQAGYWA